MTDRPSPAAPDIVAFSWPESPQDAYPPWSTRVLAWIIDYLPVPVVVGIGYAVLALTRETVCITDTSEFALGEFCATGASTVGQLSALLIAPLIALAYVVWNLGYRQGTTGSSIGKSIMRFQVVNENTGQPIGFVMSFVREVVYLVACVAFGLLWLIAVLFPLWDQKRQSLVDKLVHTICVPL
ncbi:RDD family protein [Mycolicibacterium sp. XJ1819]